MYKIKDILCVSPQMFINIKTGSNMHQISIRSHKTYSHMFRVIKTLKDLKLLSLKRKGRQNIVALNDRGMKLVKISKKYCKLLKACL